MNIAVREEIPLVRKRLDALFATRPYGRRLLLEDPIPTRHYALVLWEGARFTPRLSAPSDVTLLPFSVPLVAPPECGTLLLGGMDGEAQVSFSSIGEESALLYVSREFFIGKTHVLPFEKKVPFDRRFSLYKNLAAGFALSLADLYFGEES